MVLAPANPILDEIDYWSGLGVPVLPGALGKKGAWPPGWPEIPAEETWARSREAAVRPINLAVRLGPTVDGSRFLGHIDLDGKCPCGGDLSDHETVDGRLGACHAQKCQQRGCECEHYAGAAPDEALARLKALLPEQPLLIKTRRGYHAYFWSPREYPASVLPEFGADVAANSGALSVIPPSVHPSSTRYEYLHKPLHDLPLIDLEAIGLQPVSKGQPRGASTGRRPANNSAQPLSSAPAEVQSEFLELLGLAGVYPSGRTGDEAHVCPGTPTPRRRSASTPRQRSSTASDVARVEGSSNSARWSVSYPRLVTLSTDPMRNLRKGCNLGVSRLPLNGIASPKR